MDAYFLGVVSFIGLLFLSGVVFIFSKRIHFPYTIALVAFGILLGLLVKFVPAMEFLTAFKLTQDTLLYIFLPVLLFESAYNIKFREIVQHTRAIGLLAVFGLIISAIFTAVVLYFLFGWLGMSISFLVLFAFGTLISATDPVAVLALFKEMGAPKRLTLIFEGESLFNDGTAIALLLVILGILIHNPGDHQSMFMNLIDPLVALSGNYSAIIAGIVSFVCMIALGFLIGGAVGYLASRSIRYIQKSHILEVALTLIIAHATFLFAEWINHVIIPVSPVIATTIAALVMGNYGRYKLSTETRHIMGEYWEFFAFIANSMVFLLVGIMIVGLDIKFSELWIPIILSILTVVVARAVSVYSVLIPLNFFKKEFIIPTTWMHLLSWGSLRGGLAIIMALFIPADFVLPEWPLQTSVRDFVLALTVGCIIFTTFVKATMIPYFLQKFKITAPTSIDTIDYAQGRVLFLLKIIAQIKDTAERGYMSEEQKVSIVSKYQQELDQAHNEFFAKIKDSEDLENILERMLALHALEIEKAVLVDLFNHHEVPEWILRRMLNKLESQIERVEDGKTQIKECYDHKIARDTLIVAIEEFLDNFRKKRNMNEEKYFKSRARVIILEKVLRRFEIFESVDEIAESHAFADIIERYKLLLKNAQNLRQELLQKEEIQELEKNIIIGMLQIRQGDVVEYLSRAGLISHKTGKELLLTYENTLQ